MNGSNVPNTERTDTSIDTAAMSCQSCEVPQAQHGINNTIVPVTLLALAIAQRLRKASKQ